MAQLIKVKNQKEYREMIKKNIDYFSHECAGLTPPDNNYDKICFCSTDEKILAVILEVDIYGIKGAFVYEYTDYITEDDMEQLYDAISKNYKYVLNIRFCGRYIGFDHEPIIQKHFYEIEYASSFDSNYEYLYDSYSHSYNDTFVTSESDKYIFRDYVDKKIEYRDEKIEYSIMDRNQILEEIQGKDNMLWQNCSNKYCMYVGMHYFIPSDAFTDNKSYVIAKCGDLVVGAIQFGVYGNDDHKSVSYVDVSYNFRRHCIAMEMINFLNENLDYGEKLGVSVESEMGKICHIHRLFKELMPNREIIV